MIKVLIADDHAIVRHGLKQFIDAETGMSMVAEAQNGKEVFEIIKKISVDVVVLDISMPGKNGLEILKELRQQKPHIKVIILSMHPQDQYAVRALKAGATGYINKESVPEELVKAIKKVYRGEKFITAEVAELLADYVELGNLNEPHKLLSDREYEVLCLIGKGKTVRQISEFLFVSIKTIGSYRSKIIDKMGLKNNAELIRYAIENKLV